MSDDFSDAAAPDPYDADFEDAPDPYDADFDEAPFSHASDFDDDGASFQHDPDGVDVALDLLADIASIGPALPAPRFTAPKKKSHWATEKRVQHTELEPVADVVGEVIASQGWQGKVSLHMLQARWPELAGNINADHSKPVALEGTVVQVEAESSTWASALRLIAPQLVAKINQAIGDGSVTRVDVRGPDAPSWKHGRRSVRDGRGPRDTYG